MSNLNSKRATTVLASAARTATAQSAAFGVGNGELVSLLVDVTAVSGTTPSMTVNVEWSHNGSTWFVGDVADSFVAITAAKKTAKAFTVKGLYARLNFTISGTTPSFTFSATTITEE